MQDAENFAPDYAEDEAAKDQEGEAAAKPNEGSDITDPLAKGDHPAGDAVALKAKSLGTSNKDLGLLDFGELLTNIEGYDPRGAPTRAFLKVNVVVAYRPEEGASKIMEERQVFMRDLFNSYLRGLSEADVRGMAGLLYVKAELLKRARAAAGSDLPQEILIKDLIVQ